MCDFTPFYHHVMDILLDEFGYDPDREWKDVDPENNPPGFRLPSTIGDMSTCRIIPRRCSSASMTDA